MTVKMNKYEIVNDDHIYGSRSGKSVGIQDNKEYKIIASFDTSSKETNMKFAKMILDELNTGKYEELESDD